MKSEAAESNSGQMPRMPPLPPPGTAPGCHSEMEYGMFTILRYVDIVQMHLSMDIS